ncbi:MAG: hypothetical protein K0Q53_1069 [Massilibacillus sp.]|jgi:hypothetical protein|nr:hypothetical protein [Massilibacillus sp.]
MNLLLVFIVCIVLIILFVWYSKLYFHIEYSKLYSNNTIDVAVVLFDYITLYHKKVYIIDIELFKKIFLKHSQNRPEKKTEDHMKIKYYINKKILFNPLLDIKTIGNALIKLNLKYLRCEKFTYYVHIGVLNPAVTSMLYGVLFMFKGLILQYLYKNIMVATTPEGTIKPSFTAKKEEVRINCIFSLKIGNVIYMLKSLL